MTVSVQIPPSNIPVIDSRGFMTPMWRSFFEAIVTRAGGVNGALQPESAILDALSALNATPGVLYQSGASTFSKVSGVSGTKAPPASVTVTNGVITAWS